MKNLIYSLFTILLSGVLLTSCNRSEEEQVSTPANTGILPKKTTNTRAGSSTMVEVTYTYDGTKLKEINISPQFDVSKVKFTYTGDNITKIESFIGTAFNPYSNVDLVYSGDKLIKAGTTEYTYNSDGTVEGKIGGVTAKRYTMSAGNIVKEETVYNGVASEITYTYDSKKNIHRNITGLNKIFNLEGLVWNLIQVNENNPLSALGQNGNTTNKTWTYEYNADQYPVKSVGTVGNQTTTKVITY